MNEQINYFLQKYDITLNEQQKNAVCETDGAVLLLAVPGSGKTTVLVSRLGYMLYEKGIAPESKLTILELLAKDEKNIADFLDKLDYLNDLIKNKKNTPDAKIILSTIHSSKGLEYDNVYLADVYDGLLPESYPGAKASREEKERFEEERRLFYVAVTRAKNRLTVFTYADMICGFSKAFFAGKVKAPKPSPSEGLTPVSAPWTPQAGEYVYHKTYGKGRITAAAEDKSTVSVAFASGERKLLTDVLLSNGILFSCNKNNA